MIRAATIVVSAMLLTVCIVTGALAQTVGTSTTVTTSTGNQVQLNLPPASSCFICDCNNQDFSCRTGCAAITNFSARQQCEAGCGTSQSQCLLNAQALQRQLDAQRAAAQAGTSSGATN